MSTRRRRNQNGSAQTRPGKTPVRVARLGVTVVQPARDFLFILFGLYRKVDRLPAWFAQNSGDLHPLRKALCQAAKAVPGLGRRKARHRKSASTPKESNGT
jgi:hypothetical protein